MTFAEKAGEFLAFAWKELQCTGFAVAIFFSLAATRLIHVQGIPRYDLILILCIAIQVAMLRLGLESLEELKMIFFFHILGLALEMFKVAHGSWAYPEAACTKILGVPLYSGFMYSSVASYIVQAFRRFDLKVTGSPPIWAATVLAVAIYVNFYTNHFIVDMRWVLSALVFVLYGRTWVDFLCKDHRYRMPLALSFVAIGFFIWVAENIVTVFQGYRYPSQAGGWTLVHSSKIGSWFLLVILSYIAVESVHRRKRRAVESAG